MAIFLSVVAGYYALTVSPWVDRHVLFPTLEICARASSYLLNLGGAATSLNGVRIEGPDFSITVRRGCDPADPIMFFGAAVLAFPAPLRRKALGFLIGAALLFAINLARIITLYLAGKARLPWFESLHQELWPAVFIVSAVLIWFAWLQWVRKKPPAHV